MSEAAGPSVASLTVAALAIAVLLASGWWTDRRYRRFDQLPGHYDIKGRATRMDSRRSMAWLFPVMFSIVIALMAGLQVLLPPELHNGDPSAPLYILAPILVAAQGFALLLLRRWAERQPPR